MPTRLDQKQIHEVLQVLGVTPSDLEGLRLLNPDSARTRLAELKECVRRNFRRLALELHPDRTGGDAKKTELFKLYCTVKEEFEKIQLKPQAPNRPTPVGRQGQPMPRQAPPVPVTRVVTWISQGTAYTARAGIPATYVTVGVPLRVATMKPT